MLEYGGYGWHKTNLARYTNNTCSSRRKNFNCKSGNVHCSNLSTSSTGHGSAGTGFTRSRRNRTTFVIHISNSANDIFYVDEKMRIYISKYDPDYYVMVSEAWIPKNHETKQHMSLNYHYGDVMKLANDEKSEILTFIGKTKNSVNRRPDKSEVYEIIRERPEDERSRILELRKFGREGRLDFGMEYPDWV
jgi:hypothetical protein